MTGKAKDDGRPRCCECGGALVNWPEGIKADNVRCKSCVEERNPEAYSGTMSHARAALVVGSVVG